MRATIHNAKLQSDLDGVEPGLSHRAEAEVVVDGERARVVRGSHARARAILASMWAQKRDGMDRAGTGVGSANHTGALAIYDYLGFRTVGQTRLYAIEI